MDLTPGCCAVNQTNQNAYRCGIGKHPQASVSTSFMASWKDA
nr:MAG TPA: hypothetical protein [Bacteriophage sp.]